MKDESSKNIRKRFPYTHQINQGTTSVADRFLEAAKESYKAYVQHGPRSNKKLKVLHGWIQTEIAELLGSEYKISGLSIDSSSEQEVEGMYYKKRVDLLVARDGLHLGVVSIKFIQSNFFQNKNNYFEQQLGETANLRRSDIVFGHVLVFTEPIPYYKKDGSVQKYEHISDDVIERYHALVKDHNYPHVPDVQALCVLSLDVALRQIIRICGRKELPQLSESSCQLLEKKLNIENFFNLFCQSIQLSYEKKRSN